MTLETAVPNFRLVLFAPVGLPTLEMLVRGPSQHDVERMAEIESLERYGCILRAEVHPVH